MGPLCVADARCTGTFSNYLSYLRGACHALGVEAPPTDHPALRRAMLAVVKRDLYKARGKMFIDRTYVANLMRAAEHDSEERRIAMLWLFAYSFLLRLPSEARILPLCAHCIVGMHRASSCQALPACKGSPADHDLCSKQTLVWKEGDAVCVRIARRKNRPAGSGTMRCACSCRGCPLTCIVHALWDGWLDLLPSGHEPWRDITAGAARAKLRQALRQLGVPSAECYQ